MEEIKNHTDKQGQIDGYQLAEAPPCPLIIDPMQESEMTMADQTLAMKWVHMRGEILESKRWTETELSSVKRRARTTDDLVANQGFNVWRPEYDKFRAEPANAHTQAHSRERTTAPTILVGFIMRARPLAQCVPAGKDWHVGMAAPNTEWTLLKADVAKAHRRIKVLQEDWKYQVAQLDDEGWVNKVAHTAWRVPNPIGADSGQGKRPEAPIRRSETFKYSCSLGRHAIGLNRQHGFAREVERPSSPLIRASGSPC